MEFRPARPSDAPVLVRLMHAAIDAHAPAAYTEAERLAWKGRVDAARLASFIEDPDERFVVAVRRDAVEGFASRKGPLIRLLYVDPSAGGKGVGRVLMDHLEAEARRSGLAHLELDASKNAVPFYQRLGYTTVETTGCGSDALMCTRMRKTL